MRGLLMGALLAGLLAACASKDVKDQPGAAVEDRVPSTAQPVPATPQPSGETRPLEVSKPPQKPLGAIDPRKDPGNILSKRSVYFDYDSAIVKDEYKPLVSAHSKFLTDRRSDKITIEGNTDERGSSEYNLALGQRRADAVKKMMLLLGVTDAQIETVSFGEEKPRAPGKDEESYAQNRRSDIRYQSE